MGIGQTGHVLTVGPENAIPWSIKCRGCVHITRPRSGNRRGTYRNWVSGTTTSDFDDYDRLTSRAFSQSGLPTLRSDFEYD